MLCSHYHSPIDALGHETDIMSALSLAVVGIHPKNRWSFPMRKLAKRSLLAGV